MLEVLPGGEVDSPTQGRAGLGALRLRETPSLAGAQIGQEWVHLLRLLSQQPSSRSQDLVALAHRARLGAPRSSVSEAMTAGDRELDRPPEPSREGRLYVSGRLSALA